MGEDALSRDLLILHSEHLVGMGGHDPGVDLDIFDLSVISLRRQSN